MGRENREMGGRGGATPLIFVSHGVCIFNILWLWSTVVTTTTTVCILNKNDRRRDEAKDLSVRT